MLSKLQRAIDYLFELFRSLAGMSEPDKNERSDSIPELGTQPEPVAVQTNQIMSEIELPGIENLTFQFDSLSTPRLSMLLSRAETVDIAKQHGVVLPRKYLREAQIIDLVQDAREKPESRIPCDCDGVGLRWAKADNYLPVDVFIDPSVDRYYNNATATIVDRMAYLSSVTERLNLRRVMDRRQCDILIDSLPEDSDGRGNTLGWTRFYRVEGSEDLDVFGDSQASVKISMDPAEFWTGGFFATTSLHELEHAVGVTHIQVFGNIIYPEYLGVQLIFGNEELEFIQRLYGVPTVRHA